MLAYAHRVTGGRHDWAEEAVQETFLRLCRQDEEMFRWQDDERGTHLRAWLFKVCRQRIIDMQRTDHTPAAQYDESLATISTASDLRSDPSASPQQRIEQQETNRRLREAIQELPARQRELLQLKVHSGMSYRQIAEATGLTVSNVGYLLHQAMQTLRSGLQSSDLH